MDKITEKAKWITFYGSLIEIGQMSHQHISNVLWYYSLVVCSPVPMEIRKELFDRFGGIQLPYHPMISFTSEIQFLINSGYTSGEPNADIIVNGKWIGKIVYN